MARRISSPVIVGRHAELAELRAAMERGAAGDTETVVVSGEAGVGKTRLVGELARVSAEAASELIVGGCPALVDSPLPYAPIIAAIDALLRDRDNASIATLLDGIGPDLLRIAPSLRSRSAIAEPAPVPEALIPGRVFDAVRTLFRRGAASHSLIVVFEDLHWADPASLDLIGYLVRSRGWPGLIVLTYRNDELHRRHPLLPWIAELVRVPSVEVVELHRLGRDDVGGQVEAILGRAPDSALVDELVQRAGGNAFITEELLASIQPDGRIPRNTGVTQMLLARVAMLPDEARPVVDAMSVSSARLDTAMLATILGTPERDVEASIRIALDGQVLLPTEDGSGCMFRHALLQEAVYDGLLPGERQRYHLGFARALEAASQSGPTPSAALLAEVVHHAVAANDLSMALRVSVAAGIAASSAGAFVDASRHLERALQLFDAVPGAGELVDSGRAGLLKLAAEAANFSSDPARAVRLWEQAIDAAGPDAPLTVRAELLLGLAISANDTLQDKVALESTRAANELLTDEPPSSLRAQAIADLARDLFVANRYMEGIEVAEAAIAMASEVGDRRIEALARSRIALNRLQMGDPDGAMADIEAAMDIARTTRDRYVVASVYMNAGWLFDTIADPGRAGEILATEGIPLAADLGLPTLALAAQAAWYLWQAGRWSEGQRVLDLAAHDGSARSGRHLVLELTQTLYDAVRSADDGGDAASGPLPPDDAGPWVICAERALWHGRAARAAELATQGLEIALLSVDRGDRSNRGWLLRQIARAEADLATAPGRGRGDAASRAAVRAIAAVERSLELLREAHPSDMYGDDMTMNLPLTEAESTRAAGRSDPDAWTRAIDTWEGAGRVFEPAYARYRLAEALLAAGGRRSEAVASLRAARAAAAGLGAVPLLREIDALATRSRLVVDATATVASVADGLQSSLPSPLTRRELEVLSLLAEGRSNRQIAETLFISESTAGVHVSNILGKLGVTGRTEAAAIAFRSGLVPGESGLQA